MFYLFGILFIFFVITLLYVNYKLYVQSRKETPIPFSNDTDALNASDKNAILKTLHILNEGYEKRDLSQVDFYIDETMKVDNILILGTNPNEVFNTRQGVYNLLYGDWKYWGQVKLDVDNTLICKIDNVAYFVLKGEVQINIWKLKVPLKLTGIMVKENTKWLINKLHFVADYNTNYVIFGLLLSFAAFLSLLLSIVSLLLLK